jgi:transcriptional regulator of acetoin/glycerol metabolism
VPSKAVSSPATVSLEEKERQTIVEALIGTDWNESRTAKNLGVSRGRILGKMKKYGIRRPPKP